MDAEAFWSTFVGGIASAVVALVGVLLVEGLRHRRERRMAKELRMDALLARRRESRNQARLLLLEIAPATEWCQLFRSGKVPWPSAPQLSWDTWATARPALVDFLRYEALGDVKRAVELLTQVTSELRASRPVPPHVIAAAIKAGTAAKDHLINVQVAADTIRELSDRRQDAALTPSWRRPPRHPPWSDS